MKIPHRENVIITIYTCTWKKKRVQHGDGVVEKKRYFTIVSGVGGAAARETPPSNLNTADGRKNHDRFTRSRINVIMYTRIISYTLVKYCYVRYLPAFIRSVLYNTYVHFRLFWAGPRKLLILRRRVIFRFWAQARIYTVFTMMFFFPPQRILTAKRLVQSK